MLISLEVNDNKANPFLEFLTSLNFVSIENTELGDDDSINLVNERLAEYENNAGDSEKLSDVLMELNMKYGF